MDRAAPAGVRHARVAAWIRERADWPEDVVYDQHARACRSRGHAREAAGRRQARRRRGVRARASVGPFDGDLDAFQRFRGGLVVRLLRKARDRALRRVSHLVCPSGYLAALAVDWEFQGNESRCYRTPRHRSLRFPIATRRAGLGVDGPMLAFAGRVTRQKSLGVALDALAQVDDVSLFIAGDGPDLAEVRRRVLELGLDGRVRFLGSLGRNDVLTLFGCRRVASRRRGRTSCTRSSRRSPSGRPVIATRVGGVPELVRDEENGLLVAAGDTEAVADAISRLVRDAGLRDRLASKRPVPSSRSSRKSCMRGSRRSSPRLHDEPSLRPLRRPRSIPFPLGRTSSDVRGLAELDWRQLDFPSTGSNRPTRGWCSRVRPRRVLDFISYYGGCRDGSRASQEPSRTPSSRRARRRRRSLTARRLHAIEDRGDPRSPRRLAARRPGSTGRRPAAYSLPSPTPSHGLRCAAPTRSGRSARTRPSWSERGHRAHGRVPGVHGPRALHGAPGRAASGRSAALFVGVLERYKAFDVLADAWQLVSPGGARSDSARRRSGCAGVDGTAALGRAAGSYSSGVRLTTGRHGRARRVDAARAPVSLGGDGARGGRSRKPWPGRRGQPRGRRRLRRLGRRDRSTRPARRRGSVG